MARCASRHPAKRTDAARAQTTASEHRCNVPERTRDHMKTMRPEPATIEGEPIDEGELSGEDVDDPRTMRRCRTCRRTQSCSSTYGWSAHDIHRKQPAETTDRRSNYFRSSIGSSRGWLVPLSLALTGEADIARILTVAGRHAQKVSICGDCARSQSALFTRMVVAIQWSREREGGRGACMAWKLCNEH